MRTADQVAWHENDGPSKSQGVKMQEMTMQDLNTQDLVMLDTKTDDIKNIIASFLWSYWVLELRVAAVKST